MRERDQLPLTAIRGVWALWVVWLHLVTWKMGVDGIDWPLWQFSVPGVTVVDGFFILSGYVLSLAYGDLRPADVPRFLLRRFLRIYPLHVFAMAALAASVLLRGVGGQWHEFWIMLSLQQVILSHTPSWNLPSWSAAVELYCYFAFPLAVPVARRLNRLPIMAGIAVVLMLGVEFGIQAYYSNSWFGAGAILRGAGGFGLGIVLCALNRAVRPPGRVAASLVQIIAVGAICACVFRDLQPMPWLGIQPLIWGVLILALGWQCGVLVHILQAPPLVWLGRISFSIYLMHPMVVNEFMIRFTWHQLPVAQPMQFPIWCALVTATVLIVAQFTWFCIEKPGQSLVFSRQADRRSTTSSSVHAG